MMDKTLNSTTQVGDPALVDLLTRLQEMVIECEQSAACVPTDDLHAHYMARRECLNDIKTTLTRLAHERDDGKEHIERLLLAQSHYDGCAQERGEECDCGTLGAALNTIDTLNARLTQVTQERDGLQRELAVAQLMRRQAERYHKGAMEAFQRAGAVDYTVAIPEGQSIGHVWIDKLRQRAEQAEATLTALRAYAVHKPACAKWWHHQIEGSHLQSDKACTCGLDALLTPPREDQA